MATADQVLDIARAELGTTESPAGSNRVKYNNWYYGRDVSGDGYPWCMVFVQWVFYQARVKLPQKTASCGLLMSAAKQDRCWVTESFRPGDVVIYDFGGDGIQDHCGIVERVDPQSVIAIEGNTSMSGHQSNGGMVCRKERYFNQILGAVRPKYDRDNLDNVPSPAHKDGVEWAVKNRILQGNAGDLMLREPLTREQMCTMLYRFAKSIGKA